MTQQKGHGRARGPRHRRGKPDGRRKVRHTETAEADGEAETQEAGAKFLRETEINVLIIDF